jgi:hypothetical protein
MTTTHLTLLKSQLTLEHDLDNALLSRKLNAAEEWIGNYTGTRFTDHDPVPVITD